LTILIFTAILLFSCTTAWRRVISYGESDVDDYLRFPSRAVRCADNLRNFEYSPDGRTAALLKRALGSEDLTRLIADTKTQALIVIRGNRVVFEEYGLGSSPQTIVTSFSVSKSFVSAMIGRLIAERKIKSADQPVSDYIPELLRSDPEFSRITIRDLLLMSSGLVYSPMPDLRADDVHTYYESDLRASALERSRIIERPGLHFAYNNYNPLLLGIVIERVSGVTVSTWLEKSVWQPMGAAHDATWSLDSTGKSFEKMESGINAHAMDFARFGCMFRDNGIVNGRRVFPAAWIRESTRELKTRSTHDYYRDEFGKKIFGAAHGGYYSHFWYGLRRKGSPRDDFFAAGNKGQIIYVSPYANLVIVRFGREDGIDFWRWISAFYETASAMRGK